MFWRVSPRQINAIVSGANDRLLHQHNELVWLAWHTAALIRAKKMPKLEKLMAKNASHKRRSWQEDMAAMDQWVAHTAKIARQNKVRAQK